MDYAKNAAHTTMMQETFRIVNARVCRQAIPHHMSRIINTVPDITTITRYNRIPETLFWVLR